MWFLVQTKQYQSYNIDHRGGGGEKAETNNHYLLFAEFLLFYPETTWFWEKVHINYVQDCLQFPKLNLKLQKNYLDFYIDFYIILLVLSHSTRPLYQIWIRGEIQNGGSLPRDLLFFLWNFNDILACVTIFCHQFNVFMWLCVSL